MFCGSLHVSGCWSSIRESSFYEFSLKPRQTVLKYWADYDKTTTELVMLSYVVEQMGLNSGLHIIIFDEIDAICKARGSVAGSTAVHDTVVNQLLSKIDGVDQLNNILVIGPSACPSHLLCLSLCCACVKS